MKHEFLGEVATGNPLQPIGHHRSGVIKIPLGDRNRAQFGDMEERISLDKYSKYNVTREN